MKTEFSINISRKLIDKIIRLYTKHEQLTLVVILSAISVVFFLVFFRNGLGLAYNDARSHLDIGRRVVEGLTPGIAQLGSVWLPLPHLLMVPTIWIDFMWHSGLAGAIQSMASFVITGMLIFLFLKRVGIGTFGRLVGLTVFVANINILYLQSTAMTELLLMASMTAGSYYLLLWFKSEKILNLVKASFWIMLATLNRYDGWFLMAYAALTLGVWTWKKKGFKTAEGLVFLFCTLGGVGIAGWFLWNFLIFKDPLYFAFGPFSARAQQQQLEAAGDLITKGNLFLSAKIYLYALLYNSYTLPAILALFGAITFLLDKKIKPGIRLASTALFAPLAFNILALYLGHSVLFVAGITGNSWFNVRYGVLMAPAIAIYTGYIAHRFNQMKWLVIGLSMFVLSFAFLNSDAVTIDDATVGSSQKNVTEVSGWLRENATGEIGYILISAASHDAIIFSSGLPMKRFIHEGTGPYWESATATPDHWARWIIMRTHDDNDLTYRLIKDQPGFNRYELVDSYPFADIYRIKDEYLSGLNTTPIFGSKYRHE